MDKLEGTSLDITKQNIKKLKELFPNCVNEGKIDFDMLQTVLGEEIETAKEKYQFTWNGKTAAIKLAQTPSSSTLRPCKEKSKNWDTTDNLYIEGDNLEVLKQLQKTYYGKIKMIYIDPPYNTGHDFIYKDDYRNGIKKYIDQTKQSGKSNPETSGRYHTDWLNMIYPRLLLAKNLLSDDGAIFISIDDNEVFNLKTICDEIFGQTNFIGNIVRATGTTTGQDSNGLGKSFDYILCYSKSSDFNVGGVLLSDEDVERYNLEDEKGKFSILQLRRTGNEDRREDRPTMYFPITAPDGTKVYPIGPTGYESRWRVGPETVEQRLRNNELYFKKDSNGEWKVYYKYYLDNRTKRPSNLWTELDGNKKAQIEIKELFDKAVFDTPKPTQLIQKIIEISSDKESIILDFFSGSSTTAHAIMQQNSSDNGKRQFIMVQLPEDLDESLKTCSKSNEQIIKNAIEVCDEIGAEHSLAVVGAERIRRAGEKIKTVWLDNHKSEGLFADEAEEFPVDIGFKVFKLDSTNLRPWDNENIIDDDNLFDTMADVFKPDRSREDILYEIMLKYGIFDMPVTKAEVNGKTMYKVGSRYMLVCLEDILSEADINAICNEQPRVVVFKEAGFANDNDKINAVYNLTKAGVEDVKCI